MIQHVLPVSKAEDTNALFLGQITNTGCFDVECVEGQCCVSVGDAEGTRLLAIIEKQRTKEVVIVVVSVWFVPQSSISLCSKMNERRIVYVPDNSLAVFEVFGR